MKSLILGVALALGLMMVQGAQAQPTNQVTATCNDGTSFTGTTKSGACKGHHGVKEWTTAANSSAKTSHSSTTGSKTAASTTSGGHAGQVWVNTSSKVYHCPGDKYYGKTKEGKYLSESAAKADGYHPANGKVCKS